MQRRHSGGSCMCASHAISLDNQGIPGSNFAARSKMAAVPHWLYWDAWRRDLDLFVQRSLFRQGASVHQSSSQAARDLKLSFMTARPSPPQDIHFLLGPSQTRSRVCPCSWCQPMTRTCLDRAHVIIPVQDAAPSITSLETDLLSPIHLRSFGLGRPDVADR